MTSRNQVFASLDIGTHQTKIVIAEESKDGQIFITGVGVAPSRGLRKGVVTNIEYTISSIEQALKQAESMAGTEISSVYSLITGTHIEGIDSNGVVAIKSKEVTQIDIDRVIEAAKAVAIPADREILHVLAQQFIIDGQDGIKEPLGINGVRLEAKVHMVTGSVTCAENIVKCANRCGLEVSDIVFSGIASGRAVTTVEEQELGVCVLDIGAGTTDIIVFQNGAVVHASVVPVGGNHITMDIASVLRTPVTSAEELKCNYDDTSPDQTLEVPSTGGRDSRLVSKNLLTEIIESRIAEIFALSINRLTESGLVDSLTAGVVLTGGVANQKNISGLAESCFALPVRIGKPIGAKGLSDLIDDPCFGGAYGLVTYGQITNSQVRISSKSLRFSGFLKKVANWFSGNY